MKSFFFCLFLWSCSFNAPAQHYDQYCNSLLPFCIDIPGNFTRRGETETGSGQYFTAKDGSKLLVYGAHNALNQTLKQRFEAEQAGLTNDSAVINTTQTPTIDKAEMQENSYTILYHNQSLSALIYRKLENNLWKSLELHYPTAKAKEYEEKAKRMIGSFR